MGLSYHVVAVPTEAATPKLRSGFSEPEVAERNAWVIIGSMTYCDVVEMARESAQEMGVPCLAGWLFDDDFGCVVGFGSDGSHAFTVAVGEPYDAEDEFDQGLAAEWASPTQRMAEAQRASEWSKTYAPNQVPTDAIIAAYDERDPNATQGALNAIFSAAGLPSPYDAMSTVPMQPLDPDLPFFGLPVVDVETYRRLLRGEDREEPN
jgi:hypothetical protein